MPKETWTQRDEIALAEMIDRRDRVYAAKRDPLTKLVNDEMPGISTSQVAAVVGWMINNADTLRDRLEPFDSGERPATVGRPEATDA